ncbi:hypothetical protein AWB76_07566 [Caballeronia temeraria]|uniref:Uncharacterized protein n=1 Tax=Caballeronia temeraria TaxID=1777137 RepID=A0A158DY66_9BURK|nr:hypothetical protein AWB76_07566 [Caballeronia temeraria]
MHYHVVSARKQTQGIGSLACAAVRTKASPPLSYTENPITMAVSGALLVGSEEARRRGSAPVVTLNGTGRNYVVSKLPRGRNRRARDWIMGYKIPCWPKKLNYS